MSRLDDAIADMSYILDCLIALRNIWDTGRECNTCDRKSNCEYVPHPGQQVRYNCPFGEESVTTKMR